MRSIFRNEIEKMMTKFRTPNIDCYNGRTATHASPKKPAATAPNPNP